MTCEFVGREFDEGLLQKISEIFHEDDIKDIPSPPDVSNYLASEVSQGKSFLYDASCVYLLVIQISGLP